MSPSRLLLLLASGGLWAGEAVTVGPGDDVAAALRAAPAGAVVRLAPGVYAGGWRIERTMRLEAVEPGTALISGALREALRWERDPASPDGWRAAVAQPVGWVRWGRSNLFRYASPADLASFTMQPGKRLKEPRPGPALGFAWADGVLHVRFPLGGDPAAGDVAVVPAERGPLLTVAADDVAVQGLRFDGAPEIGIDAPERSRLAIEDCQFTGMKMAVRCESPWVQGRRERARLVRGLRIEHCLFDGGEHYQAVRELFNRYPGAGFRNAMAGIYDSNLEINHVRGEGPGLVFRANLVRSGFDGLQYWDSYHDLKGSAEDVPADIAGNLFVDNLDNAVELDPALKWMHARVHHNLVINGLNPISLAPVQRGDVLLDHNVFYAHPDWSFTWNAFIKLRYFEGARFDIPISGLEIAHNTFYGPRHQLLTVEKPGSGSYQDVRLANNLAILGKQQEGPLPAGIELTAGNLIRLADGSPLDAFAGPHGDPRLAIDPVFDPVPPPGSPAIDGGLSIANDRSGHAVRGAAPDAGAVEAGDRFRLPAHGPRWNWHAGGPAGDWSVPLPAAVAGLVEAAP